MVCYSWHFSEEQMRIPMLCRRWAGGQTGFTPGLQLFCSLHCTEVGVMGWGAYCQRHASLGLALGLMEKTDGLGERAVSRSTSLAAVTEAQWVHRASLWCSQKVLQWLHRQKTSLSLARDETQGRHQQSTGGCWQVLCKPVWKEIYWAWRGWCCLSFRPLSSSFSLLERLTSCSNDLGSSVAQVPLLDWDQLLTSDSPSSPTVKELLISPVQTQQTEPDVTLHEGLSFSKFSQRVDMSCNKRNSN